MNKSLIKTLILLICLSFGGSVFAEVEEEVIVVTNVPYTATLTKTASTNTAQVNAATGTHTGLSTVFTLQTNGGDDHFDYIISSYIDISGGRVSAYGNGGRLLFANQTTPPTSAAVSNAKSGTLPNKNVVAYPVTVSATGGLTSSFQTDYEDYGDCYVILVGDNELENTVTHSVTGSPCANTYEVGADESGSYQSVVVFTITSK